MWSGAVDEDHCRRQEPRRESTRRTFPIVELGPAGVVPGLGSGADADLPVLGVDERGGTPPGRRRRLTAQGGLPDLMSGPGVFRVDSNQKGRLTRDRCPKAVANASPPPARLTD